MISKIEYLDRYMLVTKGIIYMAVVYSVIYLHKRSVDIELSSLLSANLILQLDLHCCFLSNIFSSEKFCVYFYISIANQKTTNICKRASQISSQPASYLLITKKCVIYMLVFSVIYLQKRSRSCQNSQTSSLLSTSPRSVIYVVVFSVIYFYVKRTN